MYESTIMIVRMIIDGQILVCAKTHTVYPGIYQYRGISGIYRTNFKPESKLKPESKPRILPDHFRGVKVISALSYTVNYYLYYYTSTSTYVQYSAYYMIVCTYMRGLLNLHY